jgi:hypothetical protein
MKTTIALLLAALAAPAVAVDFDAAIDARAFAAEARSAAPAPHDPPTAAFRAAPSDMDIYDLLADALHWQAAKADALAALDAFIRATAPGHPDADSRRVWGERIAALGEAVEGQQALLQERAGARVDAEEQDPGTRAARLAALRNVMALRRYAVYANLIPRVIDEAVDDADGKPSGHLYAGPTWRVAASDDDLQAADTALVAATGFPAAEFKKMGDAVSAEYNAAHPLPTACTRSDCGNP